jgi:DNA (cytosine-5)-methyltransferase 1
MEGSGRPDHYPEAVRTYNRNFRHPALQGDIRTAETKRQVYETLHRALGNRSLTLFAGGFPCQGFSLAGNRVVEDPRNALYREMLEMVAHTQPEYVLMENVPGLRSMLGGRVEAMIREDFARIGYPLEATVLCAADYGVPQNRERVIFIGNRLGRPNPFPKPLLAVHQRQTVRAAIADLAHQPNDPAFNHVTTRHRPDIVARLQALPPGKSLYDNYSDAWKRLHWDQPSCTVKENHGGVNVHPELPRVLTARELARLQSFPDSFVFEGPKNKQLVQIGNAVPPLLGKAIGLALALAAKPDGP